MVDFLQSSRRKKAEKDLEKRRGKSATYTQPLVASTEAQTVDLEMFLADWYNRAIFEKAPDFPRLLKEYPETLGTHYALLVPEIVSFDEFWSRYYYRCSLTTILEEWSHQEGDQKIVKHGISASLPELKNRLLRKNIEIGLGSRLEDGTIALEGRENNRKETTSLEAKPKDGLATTTYELGELQMDSDIVETIEEEEDRKEEDTVALELANVDHS